MVTGGTLVLICTAVGAVVGGLVGLIIFFISKKK